MKPLRTALLIAFTSSLGLGFCQTAPLQRTLAWEIPAIAQDPTCPPDGWCGEAAIQMAMMYYGVYAPQKVINAAGHPSHPDLWSNELGPAMEAFGFSGTGLPTGSTSEFITALKPVLHEGTPVILGINVFSKGHGDAHFCIAAKYDDQTLTVNTTWEMTPRVYPWGKMAVRDGLTLADTFMGLAVVPPPILASHRLRLYAADPKAFFTPKTKLKVVAGNLMKGAKYQIRSYISVKSADVNRGGGDLVAEFTATGPEYSQEVEVDRDKTIVFVLNIVRS